MRKFTYSSVWVLILLLWAALPVSAQSPTPLAANGRLKLVGRQLSNEAGNPVQLRGISSHGLQWFDQCYTQASIQALARDWGADLFRAAMYVDEGGYLNNQSGLRAKINQIVDWTGQAGVYCIIDWHVLNPGNPNERLSYAIDFFRTMAQTHAGKKHVIYEICNEPNGVDWNTIKAYADQVIPVIRQYDPQAVILVGTPQWDQRPQDVLANPLTGANAYNVMYTFHYYAASHFFQNDVRSVVNSLPLFCSEWGTTTYSGNGGYDFNNAQAWLDLMAGQNPASQKISWCNWSFSQAPESSAALNQGACDAQQWNNTSTSGTWVKDHMLNPADSWSGTTPPPPGNQAPTVSLTGPTNNAQFTAPASINLTTNASDPDGTVTKVEFFNGSTKLGESTTTPYQFNWANVAAGTYTLTAKATDNAGTATTSGAVTIVVNAPGGTTSGDLSGPVCAAVNSVVSCELSAANQTNATSFSWWTTASTQSVTPANGRVTINTGPGFAGGKLYVGVNYSVAPWYKEFSKDLTVCGSTPPPPTNQAPTVALTAPANNAQFTAPAAINLTASAGDADGTVTKVEFFNGSTKLGERTAAPYNYSWSNVGAGSYALMAKATDNAGAVTTSATVNVVVTNPAPTNQPPTVSLTGPANNAQFTAPATITITANAADANGTVNKVEFFNGSTKLGESTVAPYQFTWANVAAGTYSLTTKATDNAGASTTSGAITIQVNSATPPPTNTGADLIGPDCARINDVKTVEVNARHLPNATNFSWWFTGSSQSITPTGPGKASFNFGPNFTGGQVCVGINYSAAPWHAQFCRNVTVCAPGARAGVDEVTDNFVFPNPAHDQFTFVAEENIQAMNVADQTGRERLRLGSARAGQTIRFGEQLPAGTYLLHIRYESRKQRTIKLLKMGN